MNLLSSFVPSVELICGYIFGVSSYSGLITWWVCCDWEGDPAVLSRTDLWTLFIPNSSRQRILVRANPIFNFNDSSHLKTIKLHWISLFLSNDLKKKERSFTKGSCLLWMACYAYNSLPYSILFHQKSIEEAFYSLIKCFHWRSNKKAVETLYKIYIYI